MSVKDLYPLAIVAIVGCASSTSGTSNASGVPRSGSALTVQEIAAFNTEGRTAYDVVSRLRPTWLRARGAEPRDIDSDRREYAVGEVECQPPDGVGAPRDKKTCQ